MNCERGIGLLHRRLRRRSDPRFEIHVSRATPRRDTHVGVFQRAMDLGKFLPILRQRHVNRRRVLRIIAVECGHRIVAEKCGELVELLLRKGIEFVVVAGSTARREAEPDATHGVHAVSGVDRVVFLGNRAALASGREAAQETGGDAVILRGTGQEVAGDLFDDKLIVRHVRVHRGDHPVAVEMVVAWQVFLVACGICIAGGIEPLARPALAEVRACQEALRFRFWSGDF